MEWDVVLMFLILINVCLTMYLYHYSQYLRYKDMAKVWKYLEDKNK